MDDLIENINNQIEKLNGFGLLKINGINNCSSLNPLSDICLFEKGYEVGSKSYQQSKNNGCYRYIRVGDLANGSMVFVQPNIKLKTCKKDDILIAFDGAPGRIGTGFDGAYSSGLQKVVCSNKYKGIIYFELLSTLNQKIIKDNSQGTTILHASKAINHLQYSIIDDYVIFNTLYNQIIVLQSKKEILEEQKRLLLNKYFS